MKLATFDDLVQLARQGELEAIEEQLLDWVEYEPSVVTIDAVSN
jgi:hypothetical protein